jgi:uncharacterized membrane protein YgcG
MCRRSRILVCLVSCCLWLPPAIAAGDDEAATPRQLTGADAAAHALSSVVPTAAATPIVAATAIASAVTGLMSPTAATKAPVLFALARVAVTCPVADAESDVETSAWDTLLPPLGAIGTTSPLRFVTSTAVARLAVVVVTTAAQLALAALRHALGPSTTVVRRAAATIHGTLVAFSLPATASAAATLLSHPAATPGERGAGVAVVACVVGLLAGHAVLVWRWRPPKVPSAAAANTTRPSPTPAAAEQCTPDAVGFFAQWPCRDGGDVRAYVAARLVFVEEVAVAAAVCFVASLHVVAGPATPAAPDDALTENATVAPTAAAAPHSSPGGNVTTTAIAGAAAAPQCAALAGIALALVAAHAAFVVLSSAYAARRWPSRFAVFAALGQVVVSAVAVAATIFPAAASVVAFAALAFIALLLLQLLVLAAATAAAWYQHRTVAPTSDSAEESAASDANDEPMLPLAARRDMREADYRELSREDASSSPTSSASSESSSSSSSDSYTSSTWSQSSSTGGGGGVGGGGPRRHGRRGHGGRWARDRSRRTDDAPDDARSGHRHRPLARRGAATHAHAFATTTLVPSPHARPAPVVRAGPPVYEAEVDVGDEDDWHPHHQGFVTCFTDEDRCDYSLSGGPDAGGGDPTADPTAAFYSALWQQGKAQAQRARAAGARYHALTQMWDASAT